MKNKLKILTVAGTRPEFIKLSETIKLIDKFYDQILVNLNQNFEYELNKIFFDEMGIRKPNYISKSKKIGISKIAENLVEIENIIKKEMPDVFLLLGDTNIGISAYVAKIYQIPIFHIEAGNRCFDQRVPEEINRKMIDHLSDINLVYSDISRNYLISENFIPQNIIKIGSPMMEVYNKNKLKINKSNILKKIKVKKNKYLLFSFHRSEHLNSKHKLKKFNLLIKNLNDKTNFHIIISTHHKLQDRIKYFTSLTKLKRVKFLKPFGYFDYCKLLLNAKLVLSDSGTINEESSIMGFSALNLRETHERPEADEEMITQMSSIDFNSINSYLKTMQNFKKPRLVKDYDVNNFSEKIVRIIGSYTSKVNRDIWKKFSENNIKI